MLQLGLVFALGLGCTFCVAVFIPTVTQCIIITFVCEIIVRLSLSLGLFDLSISIQQQ